MKLDEKCILLLRKSLRPIPQELNEIDWKVMLSNKKERLKKHLSAFSNLQGGGFLVFGINNDGTVVGIDDESSRYIADYLANIARTSVDPQINIKFVTFIFEEKSLLGVYVEESFEKPVHLVNKSLEHSYIRAGGQSRPMSKEELRNAIISSRKIRFGEIPATLNSEVLAHWEDYFDFSEVMKRMRPAGFTDKKSYYDYLYSLKLLHRVDEDEFIPTNLAVQVCAKDFSLLPSYERFAVRLVEYKGTTKMSARRDKTFNHGYSLSLDRIVSTLIDWLPYTEKISRASVICESLIPEIAIREIVANAIIHRDYNVTNAYILIELFTDRVEISNPGGLLPEITIDRLIDHPSRTRNEVLSDLMRKLHFAEERGSGIDKAVMAMEINGHPSIKFFDGVDFFKAIMFVGKTFDKMTKEQKLNAIFQHACINDVIARKTTGRSIRERFKLGRNDSNKVYKLIDEAVALGKIRLANPADNRKDHYYLPYWA
ncbi:MAG: hypothetical protein A2504_10860 [Bdellovibrionales bacterium RIFOXYD12_FULL_39_22]|nr:MAG: hypothetical protein A2385_09425 [Bdellovibrionales bacterium RIFOXYB1_FULL_39_21]OFZ44179.1 MAG: hypothetical protein A2485_07045 [Bdellovibrionales bacterium RIFOXYC12_FULL_39_17]OFZ46721.1 MAG: hypothetical protein A2404_04280 [Bdellovibrionales bacterium RIFOXYC1_FULL_39_130]OFZ76002.1 MAG: hypothetical protein A2560_02870 [Bdellovibrionales bacterium RIFOXYD1_FULL_39_84]OFZ95401.1 MAG: hypothetical protein A2504_10860 [Bdellovibrionales bacterium RIFOXYD12_FULL_39_22]HLE09872.1 AT